jgi:hypothetical protein
MSDSGFTVIASTVDPYYVSQGARRVFDDIYYVACSAIAALFRVNIYDTILMIARNDAGREASTSQPSGGRP